MKDEVHSTQEHREEMKIDPSKNDPETNAINACMRLCSLSLVVRKSMSPLDTLMKICGLTYGSSCPLHLTFDTKHKIQRVYTAIIAISMILLTLRFLPLLLMKGIKSPTYIQIEYFVWHVKCTVQALYSIYICFRYGRKISRLQSLISAYDAHLYSYKSSYDRNAKRSYQRSCKFIFAGLFLTLFINMVVTGLSFFSPSLKSHKLFGPIFEPIENPSIPLKIFAFVVHFYFTVSWLLPVNLYCFLCLSLCLIFDQFAASLEKLECNKISIRIDYVRMEYRKLERLANQTDDVVGFMALCVYLLDVILFCFHMYHLVFYSNTTFERFVPGFWSFMSVCNLFLMSMSAARLVDKVGKIFNEILNETVLSKVTQFGRI